MLTTQTDLQAENAALKLEIARLHELSYSDPLTGLANRRLFDERAREEWVRSDRSQSPLSLLLIDIDHFKAFNDAHGHPAGDELLEDLGRIWTDIKLRAFDLLARYGGEEFAVLLPDTSLEGALRVAERIQEVTRSKGVSVSIGAASMVSFIDTELKNLIEAADKALYRAKAGGRDRVVAG